jgi:hypothetical protein
MPVGRGKKQMKSRVFEKSFRRYECQNWWRKLAKKSPFLPPEKPMLCVNHEPATSITQKSQHKSNQH